MAEDLGKLLCRREEKLRNAGARASYETLWEEAAALIMPEDAWYQERNPTTIDNRRFVFDSTAPVALEKFASFLHNEINSPGTHWVRGMAVPEVGPMVPDDKKPHQVKLWEQAYRDAVLGELSIPGVNFYNTLHTFWLSMGLYGSGVIYCGQDKKNGNQTLFEHIALQDICWDIDASGRPDSFYRRWCVDGHQAKKRFPSLDIDDKDLDKDTEFLHVVRPLDELPPGQQAKWRKRGFKYHSVWVWKEKDKRLLEEGGFATKPYIAARWYLPPKSSKYYGRAPAMTALPDVRVVNRLKTVELRAGEKGLDPPILMQADTLASPMRMFPGGVSFVDGEPNVSFLVPPGGFQASISENNKEEARENIRGAFFIPLFETPDRAVVSATQVAEEQDERNRQTGPMMLRTYEELFAPTFDSLGDKLGKRGKLPKPVPGWKMYVAMSSAMMASGLSGQALGTLRFMEGVSLGAAADPNMYDNIDFDAAAEVIHAGSGAPASVLKSPTARKKQREDRARVEQEQSGLETGLQSAETAAKVIAASKP